MDSFVGIQQLRFIISSSRHTSGKHPSARAFQLQTVYVCTLAGNHTYMPCISCSPAALLQVLMCMPCCSGCCCSSAFLPNSVLPGVLQAWAELEACEGQWLLAIKLLEQALAADPQHLPSWMVSCAVATMPAKQAAHAKIRSMSLALQ